MQPIPVTITTLTLFFASVQSLACRTVVFVRVQVALTVLRFAALVLMVGSIAMSLSTGGEPFGPGVSRLSLSFITLIT